MSPILCSSILNFITGIFLFLGEVDMLIAVLCMLNVKTTHFYFYLLHTYVDLDMHQALFNCYETTISFETHCHPMK